jgi:hypothetical protein
LKRITYDPPSLSSLGTIFEPIEQRGGEFAVRLRGAFFELPPEQRETVLRLVMAGARAKNGACRELVLYDTRDGRRIGRISEESGLQLARP